MAKFSKIISSIILLSSTAFAGYGRNRNFYRNMYNHRRSAKIDYNDFSDVIPEAKIVIDTRTATEREDYDVQALNLPSDSKYIIVDYDNFYHADRFFASFKKDSEFYNEDNGDTDVDIFDLPEDFSYEKPLNLPADVKNMGRDILLLCGNRSCGCRWNLMYMHGFRGHSYFNSNVNNFIDGLEQAE